MRNSQFVTEGMAQCSPGQFLATDEVHARISGLSARCGMTPAEYVGHHIARFVRKSANAESASRAGASRSEGVSARRLPNFAKTPGPTYQSRHGAGDEPKQTPENISQ